MIVTSTEFKSNLGRYLEMVSKEDIIITRNGNRIAKLIDANHDKTDILQSLIGILPPTVTVAEAKEGRLKKHESRD
jgi:prevent-host-death family protein